MPTSRPYCYNRQDFNKLVTSASGAIWKTQWKLGCCHWFPNGNAYMLPAFSSNPPVSWDGCEGCAQKDIALGGQNVGE